MNNEYQRKIYKYNEAKKNFIANMKNFDDIKDDLFDLELLKKISEDDILIFEKNFFKDILGVLNKKYQISNIKIYSSNINNIFNASVQKDVDGTWSIVCSSLLFDFLNQISLYILYFYELNYDENVEEKQLFLLKNRIIEMIHINSKYNSSMKINKNHFGIYKDEKRNFRAAIIARNMYAFIICHEIAHIMFVDDSLNKYDKELSADYFGMELYRDLIDDIDSIYNLHYDYSSAPLIFFDILKLKNEYEKNILHNKCKSEYPEASIRKYHLISCFDLFNHSYNDKYESNTNILYMIYYEAITSLQFYLHQNIDFIKKYINY